MLLKLKNTRFGTSPQPEVKLFGFLKFLTEKEMELVIESSEIPLTKLDELYKKTDKIVMTTEGESPKLKKLSGFFASYSGELPESLIKYKVE